VQVSEFGLNKKEGKELRAGSTQEDAPGIKNVLFNSVMCATGI
jgi:hypothetical protein